MTARAFAGYLVSPPGLEGFTQREAVRLGLSCGAVEPGGIEFTGTLHDIARANLWLRIASRVLVRITSFKVRALGELERKAGLIDWAQWLPRGVPLQLRVTSRKSRLYHQKAIAERIGNALQQAGYPLAEKGSPSGDDEEDAGESNQLIVVRLLRDECSISLDSSGALLHRRGYRQAIAKAPLRETLAAALLEASGWDGSVPLLDPFCGSGTIPIEAALIARRIPPGRHRSFACERWPGWDAPSWKALLAEADSRMLPAASVAIIGSDRDAGAITAAKANAARAGVTADLDFQQHSVSDLRAPAGPGWLVSNPPYGVRIGDGAMKALYGRFGEVARAELVGWSMLLLLPEQPLERPTGLRWQEFFRTKNGGLLVRGVGTSI